MLALLLHWVVSSLALALTAMVVPGFKIRGFGTTLVATFILGVLNYLLWPILVFFTLPLTIITLGLFLFVVDAIVLRICASFMKNFEITNWFSAIIGAVVLSIANSFLHFMLV
jgi:putative membrane protein